MQKKSIETMTIKDLKPGSPFKFNGDKNRTVFWFRKIDGMYAQVFSSIRDMNKFRNPAFVGLDTKIEIVES